MGTDRFVRSALGAFIRSPLGVRGTGGTPSEWLVDRDGYLYIENPIVSQTYLDISVIPGQLDRITLQNIGLNQWRVWYRDEFLQFRYTEFTHNFTSDGPSPYFQYYKHLYYPRLASEKTVFTIEKVIGARQYIPFWPTNSTNLTCYGSKIQDGETYDKDARPVEFTMLKTEFADFVRWTYSSGPDYLSMDVAKDRSYHLASEGLGEPYDIPFEPLGDPFVYRGNDVSQHLRFFVNGNKGSYTLFESGYYFPKVDFNITINSFICPPTVQSNAQQDIIHWVGDARNGDYVFPLLTLPGLVPGEHAFVLSKHPHIPPTSDMSGYINISINYYDDTTGDFVRSVRSVGSSGQWPFTWGNSGLESFSIPMTEGPSMSVIINWTSDYPTIQGQLQSNYSIIDKERVIKFGLDSMQDYLFKEGEASGIAAFATGGPLVTPQVWSLHSGTKPTGFNIAGAFAGTPTVAGETGIFRMQTSDILGNTAITDERSWRVIGADSAIRYPNYTNIPGDILPNTFVIDTNETYSKPYEIIPTFDVPAAFPLLDLEIIDGTLPDGATLNPNGRITGTDGGVQGFDYTTGTVQIRVYDSVYRRYNSPIYTWYRYPSVHVRYEETYTNAGADPVSYNWKINEITSWEIPTTRFWIRRTPFFGSFTMTVEEGDLPPNTKLANLFGYLISEDTIVPAPSQTGSVKLRFTDLNGDYAFTPTYTWEYIGV
jgi:hypothetical protein